MLQATILLIIVALLSACGQPGQNTGVSTEAMTEAPEQGTAKAPTSAPASASESASARHPELLAEAQAAVAALAMPLKAQLKTALAAGGPVEALGVCQVVAPQLATAVSAEYDMTVSRVSLKHRNPTMGAANDWQAAVLEDFERRNAAGESPDELIYAEAVDGEFRFMKAIPTGAGCLACHGEQLAPEVASTLEALYPDDKATGYREGDIRGAFVAIRTL